MCILLLMQGFLYASGKPTASPCVLVGNQVDLFGIRQLFFRPSLSVINQKDVDWKGVMFFLPL